jgi:hypothetical protein
MEAAPFPVLDYFEHCSGVTRNGVHRVFWNTSYACSQVKIDFKMAENLMPILLLHSLEEEASCESDDFLENVIAVTTALYVFSSMYYQDQ